MASALGLLVIGIIAVAVVCIAIKIIVALLPVGLAVGVVGILGPPSSVSRRRFLCTREALIATASYSLPFFQ
mgnify:CR=1 FL=1